MVPNIALALALPSSVSYASKQNLVEASDKHGLGVYVSDLPPNHDLFQLLSVWAACFNNIPTLGTAILPPLAYPEQVLAKQASTVFELVGDRLDLGLGVGDPNIFQHPTKTPVGDFIRLIDNFREGAKTKPILPHLSIAGSGERLVTYAMSHDLGVMFNGIPDHQVLGWAPPSYPTDKISAYVMANMEGYPRLSSGFVKVIARMLAYLPSSDKERLDVDKEVSIQIRHAVKTDDFENFEKWLPEELLRKVGLVCETRADLVDFLQKMGRLGLGQVILSVPSPEGRKKLFEWIS